MLASLLTLDGQLGEVLSVEVRESETVRGVDHQVEHRPAQAQAARLAWKATDHRQLVSPGKRPITFVRRRTSSSDRSRRLDERNRLRSRGK